MNVPQVYFNDYKSRKLSSIATMLYFNISSYFQDITIDITAANSTFFQLLNNRALNLVDVSNKQLRITNYFLPADKNLFKLVLLGNYDADTASSPSYSLISGLAYYLGIDYAKLCEVQMVGANLCQTNICINDIVFWFVLLEDNQSYSDVTTTIQSNQLILNDSLDNQLVIPPE